MSTSDSRSLSRRRARALQRGRRGQRWRSPAHFPGLDWRPAARPVPPRRPAARSSSRAASRRRQLDPANSIIAGDIYTLDKIFEPLYVTLSGRQADAVAGARATRRARTARRSRSTCGRASSSPTASRSPPADVVFSINRARTNKNGPLSFLDFAIKTIKAKGSATGRRQALARRGRRSSPTSPCSRTRSCRRTSAASPRRRSSPSPIGTGPFMLDRLHSERDLAHPEAQPALLAGGQALPRRGRASSTSTTTTSACCRSRAARSTSSTSCRRRTSPR